MPMVNMASTEDDGDGGATPGYSESKYPYGLCLHLDDEACEKLGITKALKPGTKVMVQAQAVVTRSTEELDSDGNEVYLTLQITDMQARPAGVMRDAASVLYPSS